MMIKLFVPFAALLLLSGCCQVLGICTSASVHTSISSPQEFTQQDSLRGNQLVVGGAVLTEAPEMPQ
jgi:uncharacterized protein YceK